MCILSRQLIDYVQEARSNQFVFVIVFVLTLNIQNLTSQCHHENCPILTKKMKYWAMHLAAKRKQVKLFNKARSGCSWQEYHRALTEYDRFITKTKFTWKAFCKINSSSALFQECISNYMAIGQIILDSSPRPRASHLR